MKVKVELSGSQDIEGMTKLVEQWKTQYPQGRLIAVSCYGSLDIQLLMPDLTEVVPPQIVDARGTVEEEGGNG